MRRYILHFGLSLVLLAASVQWEALAAAPPDGTAAVPAGFSDVQVANPGGQVTAFAFTPDGRLLITTQSGTLRVHQNGSLLPTPALNFNTAWPVRRICSDFERGLLGVAVDPNFTVNNYIYLFYTAVVTTTAFTNCDSGGGRNSWNVVNRVSRFTLSGNTVQTNTESVLVDNMPSLAGNHNGGDVGFGKDGYLYISIGDSGTGGNLARLKNSLSGKILRVNADGTPVTSNPFYNEVGARRCGTPGPGGYSATLGQWPGTCREVFALGLRNPYRIAFDPNTGGSTVRFFINDVGQNRWEEIDEGAPGADYGWNLREGPCPYPNSSYCDPASNLPSAYADPIHYYRHDQVGNVITGGAFKPDSLAWSSPYDDAYFFGEGSGEIYALTPNGSGGYNPAATFGTGLGYVVHLGFGPHGATQALYYSTGGQVRRIATSQAPVAAISANPTYGPLNLNVTFSALGSYDPDLDALTYSWNFGDGSAPINNTSSVTVTHLYTTTGIFTATLFASDGAQSSLPAYVQIQPGNLPPVVTMTLPVTGTIFSVGQVISLTGSATDPQEGALTASRLSWEVRLHHIDVNNPGTAHHHPYHTAAGTANSSFSAPAPEDLSATDLSYLEVRLTATDSLGLSTTITRTLQPNRVTVNFVTSPPGLRLNVNERTITGTASLTSWENFNLVISGPGQHDGANWWIFPPDTLTTPVSAITYTAVFTPAQVAFLPIIRR